MGETREIKCPAAPDGYVDRCLLKRIELRFNANSKACRHWWEKRNEEACRECLIDEVILSSEVYLKLSVSKVLKLCRVNAQRQFLFVKYSKQFWNSLEASTFFYSDIVNQCVATAWTLWQWWIELDLRDLDDYFARAQLIVNISHGDVSRSLVKVDIESGLIVEFGCVQLQIALYFYDVQACVLSFVRVDIDEVLIIGTTFAHLNELD